MSRVKYRKDVAPISFSIMPMTEHDLLEVGEIEESCGLSIWGWDAYRAELARPEAIMLVARRPADFGYARRTLSGFIAARTATDEVHINNIGVVKVHRGNGIGIALLSAALSDGRRRGARIAVLEVRAGNHAALSLYRRYGFSITGRRLRYYRDPLEDALIMRAVLKCSA